MASRGHKKSEINKVNLENSEASDLSFSMDKPNNPEETINIQIDRLPIKTAADSSGKDLFTQKAIMMGNRVRLRSICSKLGKSKWNHSQSSRQPFCGGGAPALHYDCFYYYYFERIQLYKFQILLTCSHCSDGYSTVPSRQIYSHTNKKRERTKEKESAGVLLLNRSFGWISRG